MATLLPRNIGQSEKDFSSKLWKTPPCRTSAELPVFRHSLDLLVRKMLMPLSYRFGIPIALLPAVNLMRSKLLAELRAIECWDEMYWRDSRHQSWEFESLLNRRERRAEILRELESASEDANGGA
jgi:hypothetical protein